MTAAWSAVLLLAVVPRATACDASAVRAELDAVPAALSGMRIEVHRTLAPQLVLENRTAQRLEVLDDHGEAFLRIGPAGVEANLAAAAWYATAAPGAVVPAVARGDGARWQRIATEPSYGWFDPHLDPTRLALPDEVVRAARPVELGRWQVPLRVDGVPVVLGGGFRYAPPPRGAFTSRLTSPAVPAPGVRVTLLPGRVPGLLVDNASGRPLLVLGRDGEPFLRIEPSGVEANVTSPTWSETARRSDPRATSSTAAPVWQQVAVTPRFSWIEPRAAYALPNAGDDAPAAAAGQREWSVPMRLGDQRLPVTGVAAWHPAGAR